MVQGEEHGGVCTATGELHLLQLQPQPKARAEAGARPGAGARTREGAEAELTLAFLPHQGQSHCALCTRPEGARDCA